MVFRTDRAQHTKIFSVCPRCKQLCSVSSSSMCRYCRADYMSERNWSDLPENVVFQKLSVKNERSVRMNGHCTLCGEGMRGNQKEYAKKDGVTFQVCVYCDAVIRRLALLPPEVWKEVVAISAEEGKQPYVINNKQRNASKVVSLDDYKYPDDKPIEAYEDDGDNDLESIYAKIMAEKDPNYDKMNEVEAVSGYRPMLLGPPTKDSPTDTI